MIAIWEPNELDRLNMESSCPLGIIILVQREETALTSSIMEKSNRILFS
jgi:hypothetical protein